MGTVIPFPTGARAHSDYASATRLLDDFVAAAQRHFAEPDLSREAVLRRCRLAAVCVGCNNVQRKAVESFGERLLEEGGWTPHQIIERAKSVAEAMVRGVPKDIA